MSVRQYELFHGAILTKLLRNEKPITLRLIERAAGDPWSAYRVNNCCYIYVKYRTTFRVDSHFLEIPIFDFLFTHQDLEKLKALSKKSPIYFALMCASDKTDDKHMQICFIEPTEFDQLTRDTSVDTVTISVWTQDTKSLRAKSTCIDKPLIIGRSRLDNWDVPGA